MALPSFVRNHPQWTLFILLAALVTLFAGAIYGTGQQVFRADANDPQIEATEEIVNAINQGAPAEAIVSDENAVDLTQSLSTFVIIYDKDGKVISGSGKLNDQIPTPPSGTFDAARQLGDNRFTWEPQKGTRLAAVLRKADDDKGFVLAGRSLREVEKRSMSLGICVLIAWAIGLLLAAALTRVLARTMGGTTLIEETNVIEVAAPQQATDLSEASDQDDTTITV